LQRHRWRTSLQYSHGIALSIKQHKAVLRQRLIAQRKSLSKEKISISSQLVTTYLLRYFSGKKQCVIGAYLSFGNELDITPALQQLQQLGHLIAVPIVDPSTTGLMHFYAWHSTMPMHPNRFGIAEPLLPNNSQALQAQQFDALLIPLLGFDVNGHRLGMGGGYYDRWLEHAEKHKPQRIGIAYAWQQQASIPSATMDQPLHQVITEDGIINCKESLI